MILGIGTDIVSIRRMALSLERFGPRLCRRLVHEDECRECRARVDVAACLARRFAAKEALVKALGTGFRDGIRPRDIRVVHDALGRPAFRLEGGVARFVARRQVARIHLSLADEREYALAFVVLEGEAD
ncbi:MAG: holo-ACP synthase [Gammaproteobacteria bacterium]|nr:MAG: holo-ACP synthase [Gammaproteobacteria bacterium]